MSANSYAKAREVIPANWTPAPLDRVWGGVGRVIRVVIEGVERTATVTMQSSITGACSLYLPDTDEYVEVELVWASDTREDE